MKKFLTAVAIIFAAQVSLPAQYRSATYAELDDSEVIASLKNHISFLSSAALEGRAAGSEGEAEAASYLTQTLASYGVDILSGTDGEIFGLRQESGDTLVSRNVIGFIQGYDPSLRDRYIVIGARMDNIGTREVTVDGETRTKIYYGANGNASGLAMLLELGRILQTNSVLLKRSVLLMGFGASLEDNAGSWYFLNRAFKSADKIDFMINLDILGEGDSGFYAFTSSNPDVNEIVNAVNASLQPTEPEIVTKEPLPSDHRSFYAAQIPSVFFTTGVYPEYGSDRDTESVIQYESMEKELEYLYSFCVSAINGRAPLFDPSQALKQKPAASSGDIVDYYDCDYKPTFMGTSDISRFMQQWVYACLKYPDYAVENGIQGRVLVDFIIDEKGKVKNVSVRKGVHTSLDDEAVRVISASPDWKPGRLKGKKVKTAMSVYVEFRLTKK